MSEQDEVRTAYYTHREPTLLIIEQAKRRISLVVHPDDADRLFREAVKASANGGRLTFRVDDDE